jgi:hypothetical protein
MTGGKTFINAGMEIAGSWKQTGGELLIGAPADVTFSAAADAFAGGVYVEDFQMRLTGAGDVVSGTLSGSYGTIRMTGAGATLRNITDDDLRVKIAAASASLAGFIDVATVIATGPNILSVTSPHLAISGVATLTGTGVMQLSNLASNEIIGNTAASMLENFIKIEGAGQLGAGQLRLTNEAGGTILANDSVALVINTGTSVVANAGLIEASGTGGMTIASAVSNTGTLETHGGKLTVEGGVTGAGKLIVDGGLASFAAAFSESVAFVRAGQLALAQSQAYGGTISGFSKTGATSLDLADIAFAGATTSYSGTAAAGILTVTDGTRTAHIHFAGNYTAATWLLAADGHGGVIITDPPSAGPSALPLATALAAFAPAPAATGPEAHRQAPTLPVIAPPRGTALV